VSVVRVGPGCALADAAVPGMAESSRSRELPVPASAVRSTVTAYLLLGDVVPPR
jgi:hypothetical protein